MPLRREMARLGCGENRVQGEGGGEGGGRVRGILSSE